MFTSKAPIPQQRTYSSPFLIITLVLLSCWTTLSNGVTIPDSVTSMIDLSSLEQMGLAGWYSGLSLITDTQQLTQIPRNTASALLYRNQTSTFQMLANTSVNGTIYTSCRRGNDLYVGGHFHQLNQQTVSNIAKISFIMDATSGDVTNTQVTPLGQGLDGPVYTMYCDVDQIYVGGAFLAPVQSSPQYGDSLAQFGGSMAGWVIANGSWSAFPWKGVNGPVYAIDKHKNMMYFAGQFDSTADGQSNHAPASQPIDLSPQTTTLGTSGSDANYNDAEGLVCSPGDEHPWLLEDNTPGYWQASFVYSVSPSLFRLNNTHYEGRGTNQFGILSLTNNHYFNLTYVDPITGDQLFCTNNCSMSDDPSVHFQEYRVINPSITAGVRIEITSWYGLGGGLSSVEIYQSEIFVHADKAGNFPDCSSSDKQLAYSAATTKGTWKKAKTGYTQYMISTIAANQLKSSTNQVTFTPYIAEPGNYTVLLYTPGCTDNKDAPCQQRTKIDAQIYFADGVDPHTVTIDQNSPKDRQDEIYKGPISPTTTNGFKPYVMLVVSKSATAPKSGNVVMVANAVQWIKSASLPGLSSVLVYNPNQPSSNNKTATPLSWSALTSKPGLPWNSRVNAMDVVTNDLYFAGNFSNANAGNLTYYNVVKLDGKSNQLTPLANGGLNGVVSSLAHLGSDLYIGGSFDGLPTLAATPSNAASISKNVIKYNTQQNKWINLSGGVNGPVTSVLLADNQTSLLVSGQYTGLYNNGTSVNITSGNTWWDPAANAWADIMEKPYLSGLVYVSGGSAFDQQYYLGSIKSAQRYATLHGFVYINDDNNQTKRRRPIDPLPFVQSSDTTPTTEITAGAFWNDPQHGNASTVILGGNFSLKDASIRNVALYQQGEWQGIGAEHWQGSINTMMVVGNRLFIGGTFNTTPAAAPMAAAPVMNSVPGSNSFAIYDLVNRTFVHVPDLHTSDGSPTLVNMIKYSDADGMVVVGGNFSTGGSLSCYGVCALDMTEYQWNNLGDGILGNVTDFVFIDNKLMVAGNLTMIDGTPVPVAAYDYGGNYWEPISSDSTENGLPGPCHTVSYDNNTRTTFFAGQTTNTSNAYIRMWNSQKFSSPEQELGPGSTIQQLFLLPTITNTTSNLAGNNKAVLLATGFLNLGQSQGNVSAALYNGTTWIPYLVSSAADGSPGLFSRVFFKSYSMSVHNRRYMAVPLVILVSIASALGVVFVLVLGSLGVMLIKRRQEAKVDCAQPSTYSGKPPLAPDALLAMLTSGTLAATGLYALSGDNRKNSMINEKGMMQQQAYDHGGDDDDRSTYSNNGGGERGMTGATAMAGGAMMMMHDNNKEMAPPPAAYLSNPSGAFGTSQEMQNTAPASRGMAPNNRSSYNPFRMSSTIGLAMSEPPSAQQQQQQNTDTTLYNNVSSGGDRGVVQGDVRWTTTDVGKDTSAMAFTQPDLRQSNVSNLPNNSNMAAAPGGAPAHMTMMAMPVMSLAQVERMAHDSIQWPNTQPTGAAQDGVHQAQPVMWTQNVPNRGDAIVTSPTEINSTIFPVAATAATAATAAAGMAATKAPRHSTSSSTSTNSSLTEYQHQQQQVRGMPARASPFSTYTSALDYQSAPPPTISMNNNEPATTNEENHVRWTHFNANDAQDTLQINHPVTQSTYSEYSLGDYMTPSSHDVSQMPSSGGLGGVAEGFSSDPDFARWTTVTPDIQQGRVETVPAVPTTAAATTAAATTAAAAAMVKNNSTSSDKPSMERNTYTSGLRFSSVILPDDIQHPILSSPASSRKSSVSSMASYHAVEDRQAQQQQPTTSSSAATNDDKPTGHTIYDDYRPLATATAAAATTAAVASHGKSSQQQLASKTKDADDIKPTGNTIYDDYKSLATSTTAATAATIAAHDKSSHQQPASKTKDTDDINPTGNTIYDDYQSLTTAATAATTSAVGTHDKSSHQQPASKTKDTNDTKPTGNATFDYYQPRSAAQAEPIDTSTSAFRWSDIVASSSPTDKSSTTLDIHPSEPVAPTSTATAPNSSGQPSTDLLSTSPPTMERKGSSSSGVSHNGGHSALDGRAASKKMIQEYFSSRVDNTPSSSTPATTSNSSKRQKYKSDFKRAMQAALENNNKNQDMGCSEEHPYLYVAKFDFNAREHGELGFEKGDPIIVIDAEDDIWWMGYKDFKDTGADDDDDMVDPQQGVFPSNYVERATVLPY